MKMNKRIVFNRLKTQQKVAHSKIDKKLNSSLIKLELIKRVFEKFN